MQQPTYVQGQPTVVVVQQTAPNQMNRDNYAGDFTLSRSQNDCTFCGRPKLPDSDDSFQVCLMNKGSSACCFTMEHPDLVIKAIDIGEISPMPKEDEYTVCCYCCCYVVGCMMPNHDLCIKDSSCLCQHSRGECNVGEADSCLKCTSTNSCCDWQRAENCACLSAQYRMDVCCLCQSKGSDSCDATCHTCCKGQQKTLCLVSRFAFPPDDDVPCGLKCCNVGCGGQVPDDQAVVQH